MTEVEIFEMRPRIQHKNTLCVSDNVKRALWVKKAGKRRLRIIYLFLINFPRNTNVVFQRPVMSFQTKLLIPARFSIMFALALLLCEIRY